MLVFRSNLQIEQLTSLRPFGCDDAAIEPKLMSFDVLLSCKLRLLNVLSFGVDFLISKLSNISLTVFSKWLPLSSLIIKRINMLNAWGEIYLFNSLIIKLELFDDIGNFINDIFESISCPCFDAQSNFSQTWIFK